MKRTELLSHETTWMNPEDIRVSKIDHKKTLTEFHLHKVSKTVKFIETECRMVVNGFGGGRKGDLLFNAYRASDMQDEKVRKICLTTM